MAKKTFSYFSVMDFFGFRLAIPFENSLSLSAAVIHAILYPQRSQSDELGTLSIQAVLQNPRAFLDVVHAHPAELEVSLARQISHRPWPFPLSLALPPFARMSVVSPQYANVAMLFPPEEVNTGDEQAPEEMSKADVYDETPCIKTPYLAQLRHVFSASNQKCQ